MSQPNLPSHWKLIPLGELSNIQSGGTPSREKPEFYGGQIKWVKTLDLNEGIVTETGETINELGFQSIRGKLRPPNTVMVAMYGGAGTVGKSGVLGVPATTNQAVCCIEPNLDKFDSFYLLYHLIYLRPTWMREAIGTRKDPNISKGIIENTKIPLPPLPEQRAIAHTLRTIQKAKEARQRELELERERKAALMQYLFTHGTRNEPSQKTKIGEIPESWQVSKLGQLIASGPQNGLYKPASCYGDGVPILRIDAFNSGDIIDTQKLKRLQLSNEELEKYALSEGDIIINRVNGSSEIVGKCALVAQLPEATVFESNMIRFAVNAEELSNNFLIYFLGSNQAREQFRQKARITHQKSLNQQDIKSLLIPLPHISEQKHITDVLLACNRKITALEQEATLLNELFQAMLEELMTGRLSALPLMA